MLACSKEDILQQLGHFASFLPCLHKAKVPQTGFTASFVIILGWEVLGRVPIGSSTYLLLGYLLAAQEVRAAAGLNGL